MKDQFSEWYQVFLNSMQAFGEKFLGTILPKFLVAISILIIGWLFAKLVSILLRKFLEKIKFNALVDKFDATNVLAKAEIKLLPHEIFSKFVYWVLLLLVLVTSADVLGFRVVSDQINNLISYLPQLFLASIIFIVGAFIARFVRDVIKVTTSSLGLSAGKIITNFIFYFLMVIVTLTALNEAGVDTSIITTNLVLILGVFLIAGGIAYGFAARPVMSNILGAYFAGKQLKVGQNISIGDVKGVISEITSSTITVDTGKELVIIPADKLVKENIHITKT